MECWEKVRELNISEPSGYDPTGWIDCECGYKHLFITDEPSECPDCNRKYMTEVKVFEVVTKEI